MDVREKYQLWDSFLERWPREMLKQMTLEQYVSVDDNDTFTYWLETKTRKLGSIQGNTSAKFGIYKRKKEEANTQNGIKNGAVYSWWQFLGETEEEVFTKVKAIILEIVDAVQQGDMESIEKIYFSSMVKWKIAFLYQNRQNPCLINTSSKSMLQVLVDEKGDQSYTELYQTLIKEKGNQDLFAFGEKCWKTANAKKQVIENKKLLSHFRHIEQFEKHYRSWSDELVQEFCNLIREANKQKLDVFTTDMKSGDVIRIGRKELNDSKASNVFTGITPLHSDLKYEQRYEHREQYYSSPLNAELIESLKTSKVLKKFAAEFPIARKAYFPKDYLAFDKNDEEYSAEPEVNDMMNNVIPLNQILYGPPGTGKTYYTIEAAVKAAEPTFTWSSRSELKAKYDALVNDKRIRFVTFHQSFGYEEFVEGIKPDVNDSDSICYSVESGVFKQICEDASLSTLPDNSSINKDGRVWKISIEGAHQNRTKEYCLKENLAAIGWCETGDLSSSEKNQYFQELGKNAQNSLLYFSQEMMEGDLVLCIDSATSIEAVGVVTGPYRYESKGLPVGRTDYTHQRPVQWLQQGFSVDLKELNDNKRFSLPTCYPLERMTVSDVLRHLEANNIQLPEYQSTGKKQNYVIVIDEINRGNISKIFGELITLIEPSKRDGNEEALKLSLPYSGKPFSVPNNLYIIGTMNTADRSLTMLDTALRRRFDFVEMMPDPTTLESTVVKGIDLTQLLTKLNERIEVLYDREHTLGHAFLIPVKEALADGEDVAFHKLSGVFQNKIIPLLQEYFFEDWQKIRLVLGDNQKPAELQFITEETLSDQRLSNLFGSGHGLNQYGDEQRQFKLKPFTDDDNQNVWAKPEAYLAIYNKSVKQAEVKNDQSVTEGAVA